MSVAFPPCPKCDGDGFDVEHGVIDQATGEDFGSAIRPCPSCGGCGVLITDELVEVGAEALFALTTEGMPVEPFGTYATDEQYRTKARAVLVAVVEKLKENQQ